MRHRRPAWAFAAPHALRELAVTDETLVSLGKVVKPHGIRGEIRFAPFNPTSTTVKAGSIVILRQNGAEQPRRVIAVRPHKHLQLLTLEDCTSMTAAETLVGAEVCVPASALPAPDPGEVYHRQILGLAMVTLDGTAVGTVVEIMPLPSADVCVVRADSREHLVPLVADIVKEIDVQGGRIVIDPPPGLLDI